MNDNLSKPIAPDPIFRFVALADTHIRGDEKYRARRMRRALKAIERAKRIDAFVILGDITDHGYQKQWKLCEQIFSGFHLPPTILAMGNHDAWTHEENTPENFDDAIELYKEYTSKITGYARDRVYFRHDIGKFTFLTLGSEAPEKEAYIGEKQLDWLNAELGSVAPDRPVFVLSHFALNQTHGLPNTSGSKTDDVEVGGFGIHSDAVNAVLQQFPNAVLFSGHSHMGFAKKQSYSTVEKAGNILSANLPCFMFPNHDGKFDWGCGMIVEVYRDQIFFRGYNFLLNKYYKKYLFSSLDAPRYSR